MCTLRAALTAILSTSGRFPIENAPARIYNGLYGQWHVNCSVPGGTADTYPRMVEPMHAHGYEIGHHSYEHE
jgi:hypothetical protein